MKQIPLTKGYVAYVDDVFYPYLSKFKWYSSVCKNGSVYAFRTDCSGKKRKTILMHRDIVRRFPVGQKLDVDHIDGNGLNNQSVNLRVCTRQENLRNAKKRKKCSSRYKGVYWLKRDSHWMVELRVGGKVVRLGSFDNEIEAAQAYDIAAKHHFGEFAKLNF